MHKTGILRDLHYFLNKTLTETDLKCSEAEHVSIIFAAFVTISLMEIISLCMIFFKMMMTESIMIA